MQSKCSENCLQVGFYRFSSTLLNGAFRLISTMTVSIYSHDLLRVLGSKKLNKTIQRNPTFMEKLKFFTAAELFRLPNIIFSERPVWYLYKDIRQRIYICSRAFRWKVIDCEFSIRNITNRKFQKCYLYRLTSAMDFFFTLSSISISLTKSQS